MSKHQLSIAYQLSFQSDWHVGSGYGSMMVDRHARRRRDRVTGQQIPYVPGSQIKGLLREACEQWVATMGGEGSQVAEVHGGDSDANENLVRAFVPSTISELIVDRLFGTRYAGECLYCSNAQAETEQRLRSTAISRNSIDRATGTAAAQKLFSTEVVPSQTCIFAGEIEGRHAERQLTLSDHGFPYEYAILVAALRCLDSVGGDRNVGRGAVEVKITEIRWWPAGGKDWQSVDLAKAFQPLEEDETCDMIQMIREG